MLEQIGIYKITNLLNQKVYIGKSTLIKYRWRKHLWNLKNNSHVNNHLQSSYNKHGKDNFSYEIIEYCERECLNNREIYWISFFKSCNPLFGYNKTIGGDGLVATDEVKAKISKSLTGIPHNLERRRNQSISHLGVKLSQKTKEKQSASQVLRFNDLENIKLHRISMSMKSILQLDFENNVVNEFISIREAERITKIHSSTISRVCTGERKTAGGYFWKYK